MTGWSRWRGPLLTFLAGRSIRQLVLGAGALVLLVSGLFGGLARAEPDELETLKPGRAVETGPFALTVTKVGWTTDLGETLGESERGRFLVVYATVSSRSDQGVDGFVMLEAVRFRGLEGFTKNSFSDQEVDSEDSAPQLVSRDDRVPVDSLNPGLTYDVAYYWDTSDDAPVPTTADVTVYDHGFRQSSLDDQENWFDRFESATGTLPVEELTP